MVAIREMDYSSEEDVELVRELFLDYANWLGLDLCFQGFERELATLPGDYAASKRGAIFIAEVDGEAVGCAALHPCFGEHDGTHICEVKRFFVRSGARGMGIGRQLLDRVMARARELGYTHMRLDTIPSKMRDAVALYERSGFYEIGAYRPNPAPDVQYFEKEL
ncbi:MAG TPA: GNAT family N-acetyltransferase [Terriglobales bacterium]